jgi:transcriptional regulator with XRE-family HTH domain
MLNKLKSYREMRSLSQKELGQILGITQAAVSKLELGLSRGSVEIWDKAEAFFGVDQKTLRGIDQPDPNMLSRAMAEAEKNKRIKVIMPLIKDAIDIYFDKTPTTGTTQDAAEA